MDNQFLKTKIEDLFIVKENDGSYNLFGKYVIFPESSNLYKVSILGEQTSYSFSSLRNAVTWCVFEKNKKYKEIKRIYELDELIGSLEVSIAQNKKLLERAKEMDKYIFAAKLEEAKYKKRNAIREIEEYATLSRHWQTKKFKENQGKI